MFLILCLIHWSRNVLEVIKVLDQIDWWWPQRIVQLSLSLTTEVSSAQVYSNENWCPHNKQETLWSHVKVLINFGKMMIVCRSHLKFFLYTKKSFKQHNKFLLIFHKEEFSPSFFFYFTCLFLIYSNFLSAYSVKQYCMII